MATSVKRKSVLDDTPLAALAPQAGDPGNGTNQPPKPNLFTNNPDVVDFATLKAGQYNTGSLYSGLYGNDWVALPRDQAAAAAIGYNPANTFHGNDGNDTVIGAAMNDRIGGDGGSDRLWGWQGDDTLTGADGADWLIGGTGNDQLTAGTSIDDVRGGDGNDILVSLEDDQHLLALNSKVLDSTGHYIYRDTILGEAGDDFIFATNLDKVDGGTGNDTVQLLDETGASTWTAAVLGRDGNDTITGSAGDDYIYTGHEGDPMLSSWWTTVAGNGGFADVVKSGDGNDWVSTMAYCNATVDTGKGDDTVYSVGLWDIIATGDGEDELLLWGGACQADLGAGNDDLVMVHAAYGTSNASQITLGAGADTVTFAPLMWYIESDLQSMTDAPTFLDFDLGQDVIDFIYLHNGDLPLSQAGIKTIDITGGSALIYDDPLAISNDFVFAKFNGVSAQDLQAHIDQNTAFV